jgi:hypothetical protein
MQSKKKERKKERKRMESSGTTYVGHTTDIRPQRRGRTAKETNIVCDIGFDYIGRATSDLPYLLFGGRAAGQHLVGVRLSALVVWVGEGQTNVTTAK